MLIEFILLVKASSLTLVTKKNYLIYKNQIEKKES
jgi:hypothetical protein